MTLNDAVREIMNDRAIDPKYTKGMTPGEVLTEIRVKHGEDAFSLCTVIDVADELQAIYGRR